MSGLLIDTGGVDCCCSAPPVVCADNCVTCSSLTMNVSGYVEHLPGTNSDGYINSAAITMSHGFQCSWQKTFAVGDCETIDVNSGQSTQIDCNDLISTNTSIGCAFAGSINGDPDNDSFVVKMSIGAFASNGWCYLSTSGPCPIGSFTNFIGSFGCLGGSLFKCLLIQEWHFDQYHPNNQNYL